MNVTCNGTDQPGQITLTGQITWYPLFENDPQQVVTFLNNGPDDTAELTYNGYGVMNYTSIHYDSWSGGTCPIRVRVFTDTDQGIYQDFEFEIDLPDNTSGGDW